MSGAGTQQEELTERDLLSGRLLSRREARLGTINFKRESCRIKENMGEEKDTAVRSNLVWIKLDGGRCLPKEATLSEGSQKCKINPKSLRTFILLHIQLKKPQNKNIFNL